MMFLVSFLNSTHHPRTRLTALFLSQTHKLTNSRRYLRRISALLFYAPLHPQSAAVARVFQNFLDVPTAKLEAEETDPILELEAARIAARKAEEDTEEATFRSPPPPSSAAGAGAGAGAAVLQPLLDSHSHSHSQPQSMQSHALGSSPAYDKHAAMAAAGAEIQSHLLRSVHVYAARLLSLPVFEKIAGDFVEQLEATFAHVPTSSTLQVGI